MDSCLIEVQENGYQLFDEVFKGMCVCVCVCVHLHFVWGNEKN